MAKRTEVRGDELVIAKRGPGTDGTTARFNRNLAILARELVPPELLIEFHLAILQGHDPHIVKDGRTSSGWNVTWKDAEVKPTLQEKTASISFLRQAGWGMPAQAHYIEADVRARQGDAGVDLSGLARQPALAARLLEALKGVMQAQRLAENAGVEDAEVVEP